MTSRREEKTVGTYPFSVSGASDGDFLCSFTGDSFDITPANLTVTADAGQTKIYGDAEPTLTYTFTGFTVIDTELDLYNPVVISRTAG